MWAKRTRHDMQCEVRLPFALALTPFVERRWLGLLRRCEKKSGLRCRRLPPHPWGELLSSEFGPLYAVQRASVPSELSLFISLSFSLFLSPFSHSLSLSHTPSTCLALGSKEMSLSFTMVGAGLKTGDRGLKQNSEKCRRSPDGGIDLALLDAHGLLQEHGRLVRFDALELSGV